MDPPSKGSTFNVNLGKTSPFSRASQLNHELKENINDANCTLPGYPRTSLKDHGRVREFLRRQLVSNDLDAIAPKLWWMSKQDSTNISPLHRQVVKKRSIVVTEDPKLHLIWIYDRIFIKPLPEYLMSYDIWNTYLAIENHRDPEQVLLRRSALGFLRTYLLLIQHASDFRVAQQEHLQLLPNRITWKQFCDFSYNFDQIQDSEVSARYNYGEIRLTRLNFYSKFLLHKWHFHRVESQYALYFAQFYGPIIFIFAIISVFLSSLQVELAVQQIGYTHTWVGFQRFSSVMSIGALAISLGLFTSFAIMLFYKFGKEWSYALNDHRRQRIDSNQEKTKMAKLEIVSDPV